MKYFELENQRLEIKIVDDKESQVIGFNPEKLICYSLDNKWDIVINSFKDKCFILSKKDSEEIFNGKKYIEEEDFQVPMESNKAIFEKNILEEYNINKKPITTFILAITYQCNLRCSYCYQQHSLKLKRINMTEQQIESIFQIILEYHQEYPNEIIQIGLFGGEPLLPSNENLITKVFEFCKKNLFLVHITTNGIFLKEYLKKIIIYRKIINGVNTTVDSMVCNEKTRINMEEEKSEVEESGITILKAVKTLLYYNIRVNVTTNIDAHNLIEISNIHEFFNKCGFYRYEKFRWDIGRVDDRLYETNYPDIIEETDIILELNKIEFPSSNMHAAFIKTASNLCKKMGMFYGQTEIKGTYNYCWTSSGLDKVFYIDNEFNTYRCTYSVGHKEKSIFQFTRENLIKYKPYNRTYLQNEMCYSCKLGGYCAGGCQLSFEVDFKRQCDFEKKSFEKFVKIVLVPYLKAKMNKEGEEKIEEYKSDENNFSI